MKDLLLLLCHYPFDPKNRETLIRLIGEVTNWPKTVELINAHGIIALAAYNIKEAKLEQKIPGDQWKVIEDGYLQSVVRNTWLTQCWKEVNTILSDAGIKHVLLKGMALEHTLYGSRGLRQMTDNDILVHKKDALIAWNLLQEHGFKAELIKSSLHKKIMIDIGKHLPTLYKNGYALEIHHSLFAKKEENDGLMKDLTEIMIGNTRALILSKEKQLQHLILHVNDHAAGGEVQLRQFADILLSDINTRVVFPDQFLMNPNQEENIKYRKGAYKINLMSIPAGRRIKYLAGDIFPSVSWMRKRYKCNTMRVFLYYPLRIAKLTFLF